MKEHSYEKGKFYKLGNNDIVYVSDICNYEMCKERMWYEPILWGITVGLYLNDWDRKPMTTYLTENLIGLFPDIYANPIELSKEDIRSEFKKLVKIAEDNLNKKKCNYITFWEDIIR